MRRTRATAPNRSASQTEGVTRGVREDARTTGVGLVLGLGRAETDRFGDSAVEVVDGEVEVDLLRPLVGGPGGWLVVIDPHRAEEQVSDPHGTESRQVDGNLAAEQLCPEAGQDLRVGAVEIDRGNSGQGHVHSGEGWDGYREQGLGASDDRDVRKVEVAAVAIGPVSERSNDIVVGRAQSHRTHLVQQSVMLRVELDPQRVEVALDRKSVV